MLHSPLMLPTFVLGAFVATWLFFEIRATLRDILWHIQKKRMKR